jgi:hypothetical protein
MPISGLAGDSDVGPLRFSPWWAMVAVAEGLGGVLVIQICGSAHFSLAR